jgi:hypothetical protein
MAANWDPRRFHAPYAERFVEALAAHARRHLGSEFRHAPPLPLPTPGGPGEKSGEPAATSTQRRSAARAD